MFYLSETFPTLSGSWTDIFKALKRNSWFAHGKNFLTFGCYNEVQRVAMYMFVFVIEFVYYIVNYVMNNESTRIAS